jgi:hypothetical protein
MYFLIVETSFLLWILFPALFPAMARYFYGLNTYSEILIKKYKKLEPFLNFFASGGKISVVISDLYKYNCQVLYYKETTA